jgi:hypothetical protein
LHAQVIGLALEAGDEIGDAIEADERDDDRKAEESVGLSEA